MNNGAIIKECRRRRGLSMRQLSAVSGLSPQQISNIENNKNDPKLSTFRKLLHAMDYEISIKSVRQK